MSVAPLLLAAFAALPAPAGGDSLRWPSSVVASKSGGADDFAPITVDGSDGATEWRAARVEFALPTPPEAGAWLLAVGVPGLSVRATVAGQSLGSAPDAYADDAHLRCGARFTVPSELLAGGKLVVDLAFDGPSLGRGLERGPLWLASPAFASRLFQSMQVGGQVLGPANFASAATISSDHVPLERILFKQAADGDEPRFAAQVDLALVDRDHGGEAALRSIAKRRSNPLFPASWITVEDTRFTALQTQVNVAAPLLTAPLRLSDAKAIVFELTQTALRQAFQHTWRVRFAPAIGGPLRLVREKGLVLLANDRIGLVASEAEPFGDPDAPAGLTVRLDSSGSGGPGQPGKSGPVSLLLAVVAFEPGGADPSQAESLVDLARSVLAHADEDRTARAQLSSTLASEPARESATAGLGVRKAALATLWNARRRGGRFLFAPRGAAGGAEAFWGDTFTLLHFPNHERGAVERLLASEADDGSVRLDLPPDASDVEVAASDAYAVLRACRWFGWSCDGDRFRAMAPKLEQALAHADRCDLAPAPASRDVSPLHAALARAAAHRALAEAFEQIGAFPESSAAHAGAAARELATLLAPSAHGGRLDGDGFPELRGGETRDAAVALALGLADDEASKAIAKQLKLDDRPLDAADWRDLLVARGLIASGRTKALGKSLDAVEAGWKGLLLPDAPALAGWHGVVLFGMLGARRADLGTLELKPWLREGLAVRTAVRLPEGVVRFTLAQPDAQFERQVVVGNETGSDLMVRLGLQGGTNAGERVALGDLVHAFHEHVLAPKETWRTRLR